MLKEYFITGCTVGINTDFTNQHPLVLHQSKNEFLFPNNLKKFVFQPQEIIRLSCPGRNDNSNQLVVSSSTETNVTCISNNLFMFNSEEKSYTFKELKCRYEPEAIARTTGKNCSMNYTEIELGYLTKLGFVPVFKTCFNNRTKDSLYAVHNITSQIKNRQYTKRPRRFKSSDFYKDLSSGPGILYSKRNQIKRLESLLGSAELSTRYVSLKNDFFLARGHLAPKADFVLSAQQKATFFYVNTAPQWQIFNGNNWMYLENSCRSYVIKNNLNLTVYTGTHSVSSLPDINANMQQLSLYSLGNNTYLKVPEIFWKVLYDPVAKKGVVFVGHNNPYENEADINSNTLCNNICDKLNWVIWKPKNITMGYSYCCTIEEFIQVVDYLPDINVNDILN